MLNFTLAIAKENEFAKAEKKVLIKKEKTIMKKFMMVLSLCLMSVTMCFAGGDVKLQSGSADVLQENATATFAIDFSNAVWENDGDFKTWCGKDYDERVGKSTKGFVDEFNDDSKGLKIVEGGDAKYSMVMNVTKMEAHQSSNMVAMWGQKKFFITGTLNIVDKATGQNVCAITVKKYGDGKDFSDTDGIAKAFKGLGEKVAEKVK